MTEREAKLDYVVGSLRTYLELCERMWHAESDPKLKALWAGLRDSAGRALTVAKAL
jgi:hypothetical protein